jgi:hypothetical protein
VVGAITLAIGKRRHFLPKTSTLAWLSLVRAIYPGGPGPKAVLMIAAK